MGLVRSSIPRSRVPWHRRVRTDRRAIRRWVVVAALAAATGGSVAGSVAGGEASRHRWGTTAPVLVTTSPVVAGDDLAQHTAVRRWPVALVPDGALARLPPGARAAVALPTGTALSTALLATATGPDVAGRVVVAVPVGGASPSVAAWSRRWPWARWCWWPYRPEGDPPWPRSAPLSGVRAGHRPAGPPAAGPAPRGRSRTPGCCGW